LLQRTRDDDDHDAPNYRDAATAQYDDHNNAYDGLLSRTRHRFEGKETQYESSFSFSSKERRLACIEDQRVFTGMGAAP